MALLARLTRSGAAGAVAAGVDLLALTVLVQFAGVEPRVASVPALVLGAITMFFGQKYLAFRARGGNLGRELALFALVQFGGVVLTGLLYDFALRVVPSLSARYVLLRLVTTNAVWLIYSFPLWHFVFKARASVPEAER